jgi:hypothetical protein
VQLRAEKKLGVSGTAFFPPAQSGRSSSPPARRG